MQHKKAHAEDDKKNMDLDLATKLKERSQKVDEVYQGSFATGFFFS